jgi:hypothetical protein
LSWADFCCKKNSEIIKILDDDNYAEIIDMALVFPGDVIVYIDSDGERFHSGIVIWANNCSGLLELKILSKWGYGSEVCHLYNYCPYFEMAVKIQFFRIMK